MVKRYCQMEPYSRVIGMSQHSSKVNVLFQTSKLMMVNGKMESLKEME